MSDEGPTHRKILGTRTAVLLATTAAVLSLATGIANIAVQQTTGPLAAYIPPAAQQAAGFTGTLTGFLLLTGAYELRQGYRLGWYATVALLPITAVQGLVQGSVFSLPLVVLSGLSLPVLLVNYRRFDRPASFSTAQLAATASLVGTLVYGTAGAFALREEFTGVETLTDALYYTIATASTVGYGDAAPQSAQARLFGISLIVLGTASFALALGSVLGPAIQARFSRALGTMTTTQYDLYEDHVVVLGYGDLTEPLVEELRDGDTEFVVITPDSERATTLRNHDIDVLVGDPSSEEPLEAAGVEHARAIIAATNDDAEDAFAILTARELNPDARIVAAATNRDNVKKLRRAGADTVVSPAVIGGRLLVRSAFGETNVEDVAEQMMEE
ncbi:NAD-binding protein [Salinibaculum rarum]|uniref:NAD-binding protein n=1 Tax=Salinibaculum rarum TaxID=3058903 RepID=UPI00265F50CA|nr:NAD-binding protein [Salinibaculum sp. KK48]